MTLLSIPVDHMINLAENPSTDTPTLQKSVYEVVEAAEKATERDIEIALRRMSISISQVKLFPAALIALGCGALVEKGANADIASVSILQRTREALKLAPIFGLACQEAAHRNPDIDVPQSIQECVDQYGESLTREMPDEAGAWVALEPLCMAALAMLMRLPHIRAATRNDTEFMTSIEESPIHHTGIECLLELLQMLENEELIVLHPALKRGYQIRIQGVYDNFQLHILLADALIGDPNHGWLPGERPDSRVTAAAKDGPFPMSDDEMDEFPAAEGAFNLWNWQGLQPDGTLPEGQSKHEHWIWNEGKPADIIPFEGVRIILLGPPPYPRAWSAGRYFPGLRGEMERREVLPQAQVDEWLEKITAAVKHL